MSIVQERVEETYQPLSELDGVLSRAELLRATNQALLMAESSGATLTPEYIAEVHHIASTVKRIAKDWWYNGCGCLVGTMRVRRGDGPHPEEAISTFPDVALGCHFPNSLVQAEVIRAPRYSDLRATYTIVD